MAAWGGRLDAKEEGEAATAVSFAASEAAMTIRHKAERLGPFARARNRRQRASLARLRQRGCNAQRGGPLDCMATIMIKPRSSVRCGRALRGILRPAKS
jgi:hypothetical protein